MNRTTATQMLRALLDEHGLRDWHVRLTMDITKPYLGCTIYKDKCVVLNAHHVDSHPDVEVINTIRHEVAHALLPGHSHDEIWAAKARELGCDNTMACASYGISANAIDALRSGADLIVSFEEQVIRTPKYTISRLQDKCPVCGKVAKEKSHIEVSTSGGRKKMTTLECGHMLITNCDSQSPFETLTFDGNEKCKHKWNLPAGPSKYKTICSSCGAKRLFPFQVEGARAIERANGRIAIFDEMGLGKTIQVLAYLKFAGADAFPYLWVTKSGIKYQHAGEITRVLGMNYFPQILQKGKTKLWPGMKGYLCSYDLFRRLEDLNMFAEAGIKSIIIDECQAIKNPDSSRTQCVRKVAKTCTKIIPLSGTPWKNRGSELFVMLNMLDPKRFYSFEGFKKKHVATYMDGDKEKEGGIRNPKEFRKYISDIAIRRERIDVLPELPLINRTRMLCEVPEHARKAYEAEKDVLVKNWNDALIDGLEDSFATQQKVMESLIVMRQIVGLAKVDSTVEFAKEFLEETDRKLVVFVHHKKCGELIASQLSEFCAENGMPKLLVMTAALSAEERFALQGDFNGPKHRLMIASTLASGEGLNLQTCSDCIMHERQWNPANEEQAEGRFIRIGQTATSVNATYIHGDDTIDTVLDSIVERKRTFFAEAMNNGEVAKWNQSSIIKDLMNSLAGRK